MTDYYSTYDLKHVINASGKMTILASLYENDLVFFAVTLSK